AEMPGPKAHLSEALIADSDSDPNVDHTTAAAKRPVSNLQKSSQSAKQDPTKKRKHGSPDAFSTEPSIKHAAISKPQSRHPQERHRSESNSSSSRDKDEDESGSDDSASEAEQSRGAPYVASASITMIRLYKRVTTSSSTPVPAAPYKPPADFKAATVTPQHALDKESLQGKQIWYITAPASVPLSLIKDVSIRNVTARTSILSYKTAEYGLIEQPNGEKGEKLLLIPSTENIGYRPLGTHIEKTFHLQQLVELPASAQRNRVAANGAITARKTHVKMVRQQPEGLRMRYHPFGEEPSSEDTDEAPRFRLPPMNSAEFSPQAKTPSANNAKSSRLKAGPKEGKTQKKAKLTSIVSEASALSQGSIPNRSMDMIRLESQSNHPLSSRSKSRETSEEKAKRRVEKKRKREMTDDEPNRTSDKGEEHAQNREYKRKHLTANGIDQKSLEEATPKKKRKKRKSEATDMP
ncbi:MAG: hypothetical protein Q9204_006070, partial [Flavoplaca sp. TL-2023a]